jgi:hypothetical protein
MLMFLYTACVIPMQFKLHMYLIMFFSITMFYEKDKTKQNETKQGSCEIT